MQQLLPRLSGLPHHVIQRPSVYQIQRRHRHDRNRFKVVMVRHGESAWNRLNLFCGWYDAPLTERGMKEARRAGRALRDAGYRFDIAFTSLLTRAHHTLFALLMEMGQRQLPTVKTWRLNERHYGALIGLNKAETAWKYGEKQVQLWRRSYDVPPPPMPPDHPYYDKIVRDPRYRGHLKADQFPLAESLKQTAERTMPFWLRTVVPEVLVGRRVLLVAHGNSLRGLVKHLDRISNEEIVGLNLPTGVPFVYTLNRNMRPVRPMQFLGDPKTVKAAMEKVAKQGTKGGGSKKK